MSQSGLSSGVVSRQELIYIIKCFLGHNQVVLSQRVVSHQEFYRSPNSFIMQNVCAHVNINNQHNRLHAADSCGVGHHKFQVVLGGGRRNFRPGNTTDEEYADYKNRRKDGRDLIQVWELIIYVLYLSALAAITLCNVLDTIMCLRAHVCQY